MRNTGSAARRLGLHPSSAPHCAGSVRSCLHLSFVCCAPGIRGLPHRIRGWDEPAWGCADKDHAPAGSAAAGAAAMIPAGTSTTAEAAAATAVSQSISARTSSDTRLTRNLFVREFLLSRSLQCKFSHFPAHKLGLI